MLPPRYLLLLLYAVAAADVFHFHDMPPFASESAAMLPR